MNIKTLIRTLSALAAILPEDTKPYAFQGQIGFYLYKNDWELYGERIQELQSMYDIKVQDLDFNDPDWPGIVYIEVENLEM